MKLLRLITILLFFIKVSNAQLSHYEIIGNVKNIPAKQVYLNVVKHHPVSGQPYGVTIDSAKIQNEKFFLNRDTNILEPIWGSSISYIDTVTKKQTSFTFSNLYNNKKHLSFILENSQINIEGDLADSKEFRISGSKETDFIFKYMDQLFLHLQTQHIDQKIAQLKTTNHTAELKLAIKERDDIIRNFKLNLKQILKENLSNYMSMLFLKQHAKMFSTVEVKDIYSYFKGNYKNSAIDSELHTFINQMINLEPGTLLPYFSYKDQNEKRFSLSDVKGSKATLVIFWASWCKPCRDEIPDLKKLYEIYKVKGINFVSVSIDHNISNWKQALYSEKMPWLNLSNLPGDFKEINKRFNLDAIPAMFLIDSEGKILVADESDISTLSEALRNL